MYGAVAQTVEHLPQFRDRAAHINLQQGNEHFKHMTRTNKNLNNLGRFDKVF